jgi:hypothetical protein
MNILVPGGAININPTVLDAPYGRTAPIQAKVIQALAL